ncbi:hypothetical protein CV102_24585 [Natronococcus pandeyae]|uniref:Uncharacterized protein n=1 Tax=Natronococcus pandeyae TaxID=2055836 RepID=A0A8J8Q1H6_9EURY|nr:hypothetical protein CV102_24585 [Natronococcus pandeyae]
MSTSYSVQIEEGERSFDADTARGHPRTNHGQSSRASRSSDEKTAIDVRRPTENRRSPYEQ